MRIWPQARNPLCFLNMLKLNVQAWPPLGQVTQAPSNEGHINLVALLQVPTPDAKHGWDVSLWYSVDDKDWQESSLIPITAHDQRLHPQALDCVDPSTTRLFFGNEFNFKRSLRFTLRYRHSPHADWIWVRDQLDVDDGMVVVQGTDPPLENLHDLIQGLDAAWEVSSSLCQTPKTQLWMLEAPISRPRLNRGKSDGDRSTYKDQKIGSPKTEFLR